MQRSRFIPLQVAVQLGAGALIFAYCITSGWHLFSTNWYLALLFVVAGSVTNMPITIIRVGSGMELGTETLFVVASALAVPTQVGTIAFSLGIAIGMCYMPGLANIEKRGLNLTRLISITGSLIATFAALSVAHAVGDAGFTARDVLAALIAGLIYDPVTLVVLLLARWLSKAKGEQTWSFAWTCLKASFPVWPFLACCGVLLGALANSYSWTLLLAAAPLGLVFLASNTRVAATEDRARLDGLLTSATTILEATTIAAVIEAAITSADAQLGCQGSRIDTEPARKGELSAQLVTESLGTLSLILGGRLMSTHGEYDKRLLETLATITVSALDKAAQHESTTLQARLDPLTGLANRRSFEEQVRTTLMGMRSSDGAGVIFVDLDGFKKVNDVHGHKAGDEVLVQTAARLSDATRGGDVAARLGGDEFTVLLRGVHTADDAVLVAERVLAAIRRPIVLSSGAEVHTTPSVGIALALEQASDPVALLQAADAAMYEAKRAGKDCWRLADVTLATSIATPNEGVG